MNHKESKLENHKPKRPGLLINGLTASHGICVRRSIPGKLSAQRDIVRNRYGPVSLLNLLLEPPGVWADGTKGETPGGLLISGTTDLRVQRELRGSELIGFD